MTSASDEKWRHFNCFSVQRTRDIPTGPDPENRVGDQDFWSPGRTVSSGFQMLSGSGYCRARTRPTRWISALRFSTKYSSIAPVEMSNSPRWLFGLLEDDQWGDYPFDPKKSLRDILQRIFALGIIWGEVSRYAATALIFTLSPAHSDITRFRAWSPNSTGNYLDNAEKIPNFDEATGTVDVFVPRSGI